MKKLEIQFSNLEILGGEKHARKIINRNII